MGVVRPADLPPGAEWSGIFYDSLDNLDGEPTIPALASGAADPTPQPPQLSEAELRGDIVGGGIGGALVPDGGVSLPNTGRETDTADRNDSGFIPPDTTGAVGHDHVVQIINGRFRILDKNGTELEDRSLDSFWINRAGVTPTSFAFDPRIQYDDGVDRWYAASVDNPNDDNSFLFAVSRTSDPTGDWAGFKIDSDNGTGNRWADFPQMGFDNAGVYITANMFDIPGGSNLSTQVNVLVLPKSDLLLSTPSVANRTKIEDVIGTLGFAAQPVVYKDTSEFGAAYPPVFASADGNSINFSALSGTVTSPTVVAQSDVAVNSRADPPLASQPGLDNLQSGGNRIRSQVVFQNGSYWGVNGASVSNQAAIRMFQITSSYSLVQDRDIFATNDRDFIYPSIDVNQTEHVVIGMTVTGPSTFPSSGYLPGSPPTSGNDTVFPFFAITRSGADTYQSLDSNNRNRWGDYSATHFDPQDPSYFYTFQEYAKGENAGGFTGTWGTNVTEVSPQGTVFGRLPRTLTSAEGYIVPFGPTGTSPDVQDFNAFMNGDYDIDSYFVNADSSLRGSGNVVFSADDVGSTDIDTVLGVYDADTGLLEGLNDNFIGDDSRVTLNMPSNSSRYIVAVTNKLYTAGAGGLSGDVQLNIRWEGTFDGANIPLNASGDGSSFVTLGPAEDSDFYRATAPATATGAATITFSPSASLDGELWVFDDTGAVLGSGEATGGGVVETINLAGIAPGTELFFTLQSNNFATTGTGTLNVNFATAAVPPTPAAPNLATASDTGVSNTDNVTFDTTPTFTGALGLLGAGHVVRLYEGATLRGTATANASGNYSVTSSVLGNGEHNLRVTQAVNPISTESPPSAPLAVTIDTVAPLVSAKAFLLETNHTSRFTFNEDIFGVAPGDLSTRNATTSTTLPAGDFAASTVGTVASWRYIGNAGGFAGVLPNGDYQATLAGGSVIDRAGNALAADNVLDFFFLNGDANRDRRVNLQDFNVLAGNFGSTGKNFSGANFTYDAAGNVNLADFNVLAGAFGTVLTPAGITDTPAGDDDEIPNLEEVPNLSDVLS